MSLNIKDSGYYGQEEFVNGQLFYPDYTRVNSASSAPATFRQIFRKVIDTGQLPNTANKQIAHNITWLPALPATTTFIGTRIYGVATDQTNRIMIPLPYSSPVLAENIAVYVDGTNINITTGNNRTAFSISHIVVEFLKY